MVSRNKESSATDHDAIWLFSNRGEMMEGTPVPIIQRQLGHASLATTDRYLRHLAPIDLIEHMQSRDWSL